MGRVTKKRAVAVFGPGVATLLVGAAGTDAAGAASQTKTEEFDFVTSTGASVTCVIELTSEWPPPGQGHSAVRGGTRVVDGPEACYSSTAYVSASYRDPAGNSVTTDETGGAGGVVSATYSPIDSSVKPKTFHRVQFDDCGYADPGLCSTPVYQFNGCAI